MGSDAHVENPRSYLFRIADNLAIDHLRRNAQKTRYFVDTEEPDAPANEPSQEETADYRQRLQMLRRAVAELPPRQRMAFQLHKIEGLSYTEVGARMGIGRTAVEKLIRKAFAHCRDRLDGLLD
jgi:RNA polymerase sigma-70 factor (ECF subfamily)